MSAGSAIIELHDEVTNVTVVEQVVEILEIADFALATDRIPASLATAEGQIPVSLAPSSWGKVTAPAATGYYLQSDLAVSGKMKWASVPTGVMGIDGWISAGTWTYASPTTVTVSAGALLLYAVGNPIRWKEGGSYLYAYIIAVTDTQLTIKGGDVFGGGAITDNYYSPTPEPVGFPVWLPYTPTGIAASNVTLTGRFAIIGRLCKVEIHVAFTGGITFTTMPTIPIQASASILATKGNCGLTSVKCTGAWGFNYWLLPCIIASATTVVLYSTANTTMSATVPGTWANSDSIDIWFDYQI